MSLSIFAWTIDRSLLRYAYCNLFLSSANGTSVPKVPADEEVKADVPDGPVEFEVADGLAEAGSADEFISESLRFDSRLEFLGCVKTFYVGRRLPRLPTLPLPQKSK